MSYINHIPYEDSTGRLRELYETELKNQDFIPNYVQAFSLRPEVYEAWSTLLKTIRTQMRLRRYELVTIAAAQAQGCRY
jgi:hypothetical protein